MNYDQQIINRMKRIQGQLNGALNMMEEAKYCKDVMTQLSASKNAIQRLMAVIASENLVESIKASENHTEVAETSIDEAIQLLVKSK
ncbi:metal-sensitive transcriptional regulator [Staphylococcus simulans]